MSLTRWMSAASAAFVVSAMLAGCQPTPKPMQPVPPPPASENDVARVAGIFQQQDPSARVGVVLAVWDENKTAAVRADMLSGVGVGNAVTYTNSAGAVIAHGLVQTADRGYLVISYDPAPSGRVPQAGDMAIAFQRGAATMPTATK